MKKIFLPFFIAAFLMLHSFASAKEATPQQINNVTMTTLVAATMSPAFDFTYETFKNTFDNEMQKIFENSSLAPKAAAFIDIYLKSDFFVQRLSKDNIPDPFDAFAKPFLQRRSGVMGIKERNTDRVMAVCCYNTLPDNEGEKISHSILMSATISSIATKTEANEILAGLASEDHAAVSNGVQYRIIADGNMIMLLITRKKD